jgi:hypothetical protein
MAIPTGFKTPEEIAVEFRVPVSRVQTAIKELNIVPSIFPDDRRRRYYSPDDIRKIKEWIDSR